MSGQVDVRFRVLNFPDSGPVVGLVFMHEGKPVAPNGTAFSFDLTPGTTKLEADTLVIPSPTAGDSRAFRRGEDRDSWLRSARMIRHGRSRSASF